MRVLIVDDLSVIRNGVGSVLEDCTEAEVVGEAANGEEAIVQTEQLHPELIIMDINMPLLDGLSAAEIIMKHRPQTHILIYSMHKIREFIDTAKRLGLSGYVPKEEDGPALRDAIEAVSYNRKYFPTDGFAKTSASPGV